MRTEFNAKAQNRQDATGLFYYETRKPGIIEKISWFPGFLMELFWAAPLHLCVKSFLHGGRLQRLAGRKDRGKRGQRPTQGRTGAGCSRNSTPRRKAAKPQSDFFITKPGNQESSERFHGFRASLWNCFWSRLCAFASLRYQFFARWPTAKSGRLHGGWPQGLAGRKDRGKRPTAIARPGRGRIGQPCRNWGRAMAKQSGKTGGEYLLVVRWCNGISALFQP